MDATNEKREYSVFFLCDFDGPFQGTEDLKDCIKACNVDGSKHAWVDADQGQSPTVQLKASAQSDQCAKCRAGNKPNLTHIQHNGYAMPLSRGGQDIIRELMSGCVIQRSFQDDDQQHLFVRLDLGYVGHSKRNYTRLIVTGTTFAAVFFKDLGVVVPGGA